ncbi:MAG: type II secretion system protein [Clostridia bacterium]|nr:type II secretion system protein [Clostridia bacterium]
MQRGFKSGPILMELIVVILFFALSASVILQIFAAAYGQSERTHRLDRALAAVQDWAEQLAEESQMKERLLSDGWQEQPDGSVQWTTEDGVLLTAVFSQEQTDAGALYGARIVASDREEEVFSVPVAHYVAGEVERP